eukprot:TRINITY_DN617_c2_g1_i1.p1 TRINITY_DN617_c2_g1~~TRINITY_DN617_c2_g1_i1.p1  ORF type:complete len:255 (+),score=101.78 TRINITY_DN617_c2_g1_i1:61-765(+)
MAMSDEDVKKQLQQMVNFILREAEEKKMEILVKAEEEFNIEKQRLVQEEKVKIMKEFERKEKTAETKKKIAYSNKLNQSRLQVLKAQEECVHKVVGEAFNELASVSKGSGYKDMIVNLIVQGLVKMGEPNVSVVAREVDLELVKSALPAAEAKYLQVTGDKVELTLDPKNRLPPPPTGKPGVASCAGGIMLSAKRGAVLCSNTLETRLQLVVEQTLPDIRVQLFGKNPNRSHMD